MQKHKPDQVNVYAVKLRFFTREQLETSDKRFGREEREYACYKCGHEFGPLEMIALAFVNKGDGNKLVCYHCGTELIKNEDVFQSSDRLRGDTK